MSDVKSLIESNKSSEEIVKESMRYDGRRAFLQDIKRVLDKILTKSIHIAEMSGGDVYIREFGGGDNIWIRTDGFEIEYFDNKTTKTLGKIASNQTDVSVAGEMKSYAENYLI